MSLLLTEPGLGVREVTREGSRWLDHSLPWPCAPCAGADRLAFGCLKTLECLCMDRRGALLSRMPAVPGLSELCLSPCGRYLYQLSSEADCVHTRNASSGELLFAAPAGVFPRSMRLVKGGRRLLVAGGAMAQAALLTAPDLVCETRVPTPGPCFAADLWNGGLALVCAVEGEDIQTAVYTLRCGEMRHLALLSGQPGAFCTCPDGVHALVSTRCGLTKLHLTTGTILWSRPEWALCMRLCCRGELALISGTLDGRICLMNHSRPWECRLIDDGTEAQACFA